MARIRTVKPEFWEDEKVGGLSPLARLAFIGTLNLADDEGLLRWTEDYVNASLFMYDGLPGKKVRGLMDELVHGDMLFPYRAAKSNQQLGYVVNFRRHQRINRPQPGKFPPPSLQNPAVAEMYGLRDRWLCHLCKGPINRLRGGSYDPALLRTSVRSELDISLDHLIPRVKGGSDYPSNIGAAHLGCNSGRRDRPIADFVVPMSVSDALRHSVNPSVNEAVPDAFA